MQNCPACQRKLISHISPRCNWCGHEIQDAAYQEEAEARRQAHAIEQAQHDAQSRQWFQNTVDAYSPAGFGGLGVNVPMGTMRRTHADIQQEVHMRLAAEAAIAAATQARLAQEAAAQAEEKRRAEEREEAKAADDRFRHLEL